MSRYSELSRQRSFDRLLNDLECGEHFTALPLFSLAYAIVMLHQIITEFHSQLNIQSFLGVSNLAIGQTT